MWNCTAAVLELYFPWKLLSAELIEVQFPTVLCCLVFSVLAPPTACGKFSSSLYFNDPTYQNTKCCRYPAAVVLYCSDGH